MNKQLAIIGGGPAGVCSALAAARRGIQTALLTNRPVLGGNSSSEIRVWSRGAVGAGNLYGEEMGIWGELKLTNLYRNPDCNPVFWDEVLLDAVLAEPNIELFLNTEISELTLDGDKIKEIRGNQLGSEKHIQIEADVVLDATGDGTIGYLADVPYYIGDTYVASRKDAPPKEPELLGCSILFYTKKEDHPVPFIAPDYAYDLDKISHMVNHGGRVVSEKMSGSDCWWFEFGGNLDTIGQFQDITIELKKLVMGVWNYIKNSGQFDAGNYTIEWVGSIPGKRESRRMETEYILKEADIRNGTRFPDGAFYGGWYMDTHPSGGIHDTSEENCVQIPVNVYQVPLRCLYNRKVSNLLFAGRNIGAERQAFVSSRVMNTCALAGQAAGELAAQMISLGKAPAQMSAAEINQIRLRLTREDMFIPGYFPEDTDDLAHKAVVMASSHHNGFCGTEEGAYSLSEGGFVMYPGTDGKTAAVKVIAQEDTLLKGKCYLSPLPNRLCLGTYVKKQVWNLAAGDNCLKLEAAAKNCFVVFEFEPNEFVQVALDREDRVGFLCGSGNKPDYYTPRLSYLEDLGLYAPECIVQQPDRPWGKPNQWRAAPEDAHPWVELHWDDVQSIRQIRLYLDPSLNEELPSSRTKFWQESHRFIPRKTNPQHLIRSASIQIQDKAGAWETVAAFHNNFQRQVCITLPEAVNTQVIRLAIEETWGDTPAIYQIRIFSSPV